MTFASRSRNCLEVTHRFSEAADDLLDAWRDVLGKALSDERDRWEDARRLFTSQVDAAFAQMKAEFVTRQMELIDKFTAKLAEIKSGEPGPRGSLGETGPQGERGEKGDQGVPGEIGLQGLPGEAGPIGERGEKGDIGGPGEKGDVGERGAQGVAGIQGEVKYRTVLGERGERGSWVT